MQERYIFREMLSEIKGLADQKGNRLSLDEIREFFKNAHLTEEQLQMVCAYLNEEKIQIEGYEGAGKQEAPDKEDAGMMEESDCLELYQAELEEILESLTGTKEDMDRKNADIEKLQQTIDASYTSQDENKENLCWQKKNGMEEIYYFHI